MSSSNGAASPEPPSSGNSTPRSDKAADHQSLPMHNAMNAAELFDLSIACEKSKQSVIDKNFGVTRVVFNNERFKVRVSETVFEKHEAKIQFAICQQTYLPSAVMRIFSFVRSPFSLTQKKMINDVEYEVKSVSETDEDVDIDVSFNGFSYQTLNYHKHVEIHTTDPTAAYKDLFLHLFKVFPNERPLVSVDLRGIQPEQIEASKSLMNIQQVRMSQCLAMKVRNNQFVEQAHTILEAMTDLKNLNLDITLNGTEFFSPRMSLIDHISIRYNRNCISAENLLNFDCQTIKLWHVQVSPAALNLFIKKWLSSDSLRFQCLEIPIICLSKNDRNMNSVMDGLDAKPFDCLQRAIFYKKHDWNYDRNCLGPARHVNASGAKDIERSDGVLASILFSTTFFYFLVWHDRFPEPPEKHIPFCDN